MQVQRTGIFPSINKHALACLTEDRRFLHVIVVIGLTGITRVFYFSAGNSLVYLVIVLFRQEFLEFQLQLEA